MNNKKVRVGIIGVGNCASSLVQGVEFYKNVKETDTVPGLMHVKLGNYHIRDIEFSAAFDISETKVNRDLSEGIYAKPNNTIKFCQVPNLNVKINRGMTHDGLGKYLSQVITKAPGPTDNIVDILKKTGTDVVVSYLPVGSEEATKWYVEQILEAGCGFVNCIPVFIACSDYWRQRFENKNLPLVGDDIKSQVGATITHRVLVNLFRERGVRLDRTYQLNFGGNSVTGDQEIQLLVDGEVRVGKIGEIIDEFIKKDGSVRADGKEIVVTEDLGKFYECLTVNDQYEVIRSPINAFIRHKLDKPIFDVELEEGRHIKITGDHNLFILNDDWDLQQVPVSSLVVNNSYVAVPVSLPLNLEEKTHLDLSDFEELIQGTIKDSLFQLHKSSTTVIEVDYKLTDEFLQVVGMWLADGSYSNPKNGHVEIAIGNEPECISIINSFCQQMGGINYCISRNNGVGLRILSRPLGRLFQVLELRGNSYNKRVPKWVFNLSNRQIAKVICGYMSGDGTVSGKQVRYGSVSEGLVEDFRSLFLRIGIGATVFKGKNNQERKDGYASKQEFSWAGCITARNDLKKFLDEVGFIQEQQNNKVLSIVNLVKNNRKSSRKIPNAPSLRKQWKIKSKTWYWPPTLEANIILDQLHKITNILIRKKINNICMGNVKFLKVKSITKIENEDPTYVYDISTKPFERFICSNILVHNTDFLNMLERERLESKKISKTQAVTSQIGFELPPESIHVGPSDYVPWLEDRKWCYIRMEGTTFGNVPLNVEVKMEVHDSPNSAGVVIDAIRCAKLAMDNKLGGVLFEPSSYFMKSPPKQYTDSEARLMVDSFIKKYGECG